MKAIIKNMATGEMIPVTATTDHPDSSYGQAVWVDDDNIAYFQIGMRNPLYQETSVTVGDREMLGQWLRGLRISRGISVRKMAELSGIQPSTVQNVENGAFTPRLDVLQRMLDVLGKQLRIE